jgi:hypothetical protein
LKTKSVTTILIIIYLISNLVSFSQSTDNKRVVADTTASVVMDTLSVIDSVNDTILYKTLNYRKDTLKKDRPKSNSILKDNIDLSASDSTIYSINGKKVFLFGDAVIKYEDIELKAGYIEVDMEKNIIYAEGIKDSVGKDIEQPVFTQGEEVIKTKSITYNVQTKRAFIKGLSTQQDEGYLHSESTKKEADNSITLSHGKYTTCELDHPHFYLSLSRAKVVPGKTIVASYSYLVIEDIPLYPLMIPFAFFPTTQEKASGFIIPKFGEERNRGFYLREGGYYFAINDYLDFALTGDVYSKGSWLVNGKSKYKLRYKFRGSIDVAFSKVIYGEPGLSDYNESNEYRIKWTHTQDPKARPNSNFSANVNFISRGENKYNSKTSNDYLTNTTSSSISYRKKFANTPFSTSINLRHNQNNKTGDVQLNLPQMTLNMSRIFPFRKKKAIGKAKWYENIGVTYSGNFENKSEGLTDSILFDNSVNKWDYFKNGIQHKVPLKTSLKVLKYFNLSPRINLTDRMYFKRTMLNSEQYVDGNGNIRDTIVEDVQTGFYNVYDYDAGVGLGTTIYGMYGFRKGWIKAIRHVITPSVSLSYRPDFQQEQWGYYKLRPDDTTGTKYYSPYAGSIYGTPGTGKSGMVSFSLSNNLEMKVFSKKDTINHETKIKILEALNFSSSYNMMADSMNWSPISMNARTTLFKMLSLSMSAQANLYAIDSLGHIYDKFQYQVNAGQPFRITNARISTGFNLNSKRLFNKNKDDVGEPENTTSDVYGHYGYDYFDIPWNMNIQYSLSYINNGVKPDVAQSLNFSGDFSLTRKWKIGFRSGYDFEAYDFTYTSFNISRDLHCWVATLSLIPFGQRQSYNFSIGAKSAVLQDLKYNKNQSWIDNAY